MKVFIIKLKNLLRYRYLFKIICILSIIISILIIKYYPFKSKYNIYENVFEGIVTKKLIKDNKLTIYLKGKEILIVNYYFDVEEEKFINSIFLGDTLNIKGKLTEPNNNTIPNLFNYKKYLYNKKIYYLLDASEITKIKNNESIIYDIKNKMILRIDKLKSKDYLRTFILGDSSKIDVNIKANYREIGISHIFSISGMHISLLSSIILFLLKKVSYNDKYNYFIVSIFLLLYMSLLGFLASVLRTTVMFIIFAINKVLNLKIKKIDLMLLTLTICLIINPFLLVDIGFQYSYLISFTLVLVSDKIREQKTYVKKSLYISIISFLISFPITIANFYQINLIGIFLNLFIIPLTSIIIYPLSILTFFISFLDNILFFFTNLLENISSIANSIKITSIVFSKPSILVVLIYYIIIYLSLFRKKYLVFLVILIFFHKISVYCNKDMRLIMLDVGQGDSIIIDYPYNKGTILIDTGGLFRIGLDDKKYDSSISNNIVNYLHSIGKVKIDYLIITHGDLDHMGESFSLIEKIKINNVIFNKNEYNDLEKELIKLLNRKNIIYSKANNKIEKYNILFLNNKLYNNENDNSNIIYLNYYNNKILLLGDISSVVEKDIVDNYNLNNIDILKVAHHGSKNSTSKYLIDNINPKNALISVGRNNLYGFPKKEVLNYLENSNVYRTDTMGSIVIKINDISSEINTYSPNRINK